MTSDAHASVQTEMYSILKITNSQAPLRAVRRISGIGTCGRCALGRSACTRSAYRPLTAVLRCAHRSTATSPPTEIGGEVLGLQKRTATPHAELERRAGGIHLSPNLCWGRGRR